MFYCSKDNNHKSEFGAIPTDKEITYKVFADEYESVNLLIKKAGEIEYSYFPMQKNENGWFEYSISFKESNIYFYHFELIRNQRIHPIFCAADLSAGFNEKNDWQQTVYDQSYEVEEGFRGLIYQIFPDRFYKSENTKINNPYPQRHQPNWGEPPAFANGTVGAVINNDYFGGNLKGIEEKLEYLVSLGVTIIYLNPIFEAHSNHRYNTADYLKIDPHLGSEEDFVSLCKTANQRGIKIILDGVFSHTGSDSVYFNKENRYNTMGAYQSKESPYYSWFKFNEYPNKYLSWWGFETLPEVNEENPSFVNFITGENGVIDKWMQKGASGFRLDVADELPDTFIEKIRTAVKRNNGILYGEVWEDATNKESYGELRRYFLGNELDSVMNYPFADFIQTFIKEGNGVNFINNCMRICENYPKQSLDHLMNLLGTHDTERILTLLAGESAGIKDRDWQSKQKMTDFQIEIGKTLLKLAAVLQYTLPGIPMLYYGDEILTEGYRDPFNRTCFDWSKFSENNETLNFFKFLGRLRKECPALDKGDFIPAQYDKNYVSYLRVDGKNELFVVVNSGDENADIWLLEGWRNEVVIYGNDHKDGILRVPPKSFAFLGRGEWSKNFNKKV